jgi:hypothetical protein
VNLMHGSRAIGKIAQVKWGGFAKGEFRLPSRQQEVELPN